MSDSTWTSLSLVVVWLLDCPDCLVASSLELSTLLARLACLRLSLNRFCKICHVGAAQSFGSVLVEADGRRERLRSEAGCHSR